MNCLKDYLGYIRQNPEGYWFKRKLYGWGWVPVKWQGWLFLFAWTIFFVFAITKMEYDWLQSLIITFFLVVVLLFICYKKGEKPKWMWGLKR